MDVYRCERCDQVLGAFIGSAGLAMVPVSQVVVANQVRARREEHSRTCRGVAVIPAPRHPADATVQTGRTSR